MIEPAAKALGISTADLETQLEAAKSLSDVASAQGVSQDDLVAAIAADLKTHEPDGAPALSDAQATQMATAMSSASRARVGGRRERAHRSSCGATRAPPGRAHRGTPAAPRPRAGCWSTSTPRGAWYRLAAPRR